MAVKRKAKVVKPAEPDVSTDALLRYYRDMLLIRRFEERAGQMYGMGLIGGYCHLYIGQEAVVVGIQAALAEGDSIITSYRDHGHMLACGMDPKGVMAELTGRRGGYSHGKGGSMHMFSAEKGFYGGHGIVGAQVPLGTGLAFASRSSVNEPAMASDRAAVIVRGGSRLATAASMRSRSSGSSWSHPRERCGRTARPTRPSRSPGPPSASACW